MRSDMIGPRRLQPVQKDSKPVFVLTGEEQHRIIKSQVVPGVTEGQMNGVLPRIPNTRPELFVKSDVVKAELEKDFEGGKEEMDRFFSSKKPSLRRLGIDSAESRLESEKKKKRLAAGPNVGKAIQGQQSITEPIHSGDPAAAGAFYEWRTNQSPHIEAAKHYIQADHYSRQSGGGAKAKAHQTKYLALKLQGAKPKRKHFEQAVKELPSQMSNIMASLSGSDQEKAFRTPQEEKEGKEHWGISGYGKDEMIHPFQEQAGGFEGGAKDYFKKLASDPKYGVKLVRQPMHYGKVHGAGE
jgi:hypothetical protein